jgi:hypothetical protein
MTAVANFGAEAFSAWVAARAEVLLNAKPVKRAVTAIQNARRRQGDEDADKLREFIKDISLPNSDEPPVLGPGHTLLGALSKPDRRYSACTESPSFL